MPRKIKIRDEDAFEIYLGLGDDRSLLRLQEVINERFGEKTVTKNTLGRWSRKRNEDGLTWQDRIQKYERVVSGATHRQLVLQSVYDRAETIRSFRGVGNRLLDQVIELVTGVDVDENGKETPRLKLESILDVKRAMEVIRMIEREVAFLLGVADPENPGDDESAPGDEVDDMDMQLKRLDAYRGMLERQKALAEEKAAKMAKEVA